MKILLTTFLGDLHSDPNPFCYTLMDEICKHHPEVEVFTDRRIFWKDDILTFDVLHIMWPDILLRGGHSAKEMEARLNLLKEHNVKIVATCHNLHPHYSSDVDEVESYKHTNGYADVIIHLGEYSRSLLAEQYPKATHVVVPHHVYDTIYGEKPTREQGIKILGLDPNKRYILAMGEFRDDEERDLIRIIEREIEGTDIRILAPTYKRWVLSRAHPLRTLKSYLEYRNALKQVPNLINKGDYVPNELMTSYYAVSDICFIQRKEILNSGNVPMALYMDNVVMGPDKGNVGPLLKETGNPTFNPDDEDSVLIAFKQAIDLYKSGQSTSNHEWAMSHCNTASCAEAYYQIYIN